jgi:hypothetical protein
VVEIARIAVSEIRPCDDRSVEPQLSQPLDIGRRVGNAAVPSYVKSERAPYGVRFS